MIALKLGKLTNARQRKAVEECIAALREALGDLSAAYKEIIGCNERYRAALQNQRDADEAFRKEATVVTANALTAAERLTPLRGDECTRAEQKLPEAQRAVFHATEAAREVFADVAAEALTEQLTEKVLAAVGQFYQRSFGGVRLNTRHLVAETHAMKTLREKLLRKSRWGKPSPDADAKLAGRQIAELEAILTGTYEWTFDSATGAVPAGAEQD